jgi:hypothetical protein
VIAAEARQVTVAHVSGNIQPEELADLGGRFRIPKLEFNK